MMENQVTSIEQSKRLLELGVPEEKASMEWKTCRIKGYDYDWTLDIACKGGRCVGNNNTSLQIIPAFTVADLMGMLPGEIEDEGMTLEMSCFRYGESWAVRYYNQWQNYGHTYICYDLIGALFLAVTHLINKGYKLNV